MYLNVNNPVNYQLQGFGQNGVRTISTDQLYIQGEYYRVLVAEEDSYVTAVSVLGDDMTAEFVYAGTTIYGLFTEVSVSSGSLTAYIAGPTDIEDVWAYINAYGQTNAATIEAADCAKDAIAPLLDKYYAKASLVMVPSLYKTSIVYSERPLTTSGQLDFTRSNDTATRVGPDGYIEKVRTNVVTYSQDFSDASWTKTALTISTSATANPVNGALTAQDAIPTAVSSVHRVFKLAGVASAANTWSIYAKAKGYNFITIVENGNTAANVSFNLSTGTIGQQNSAVGRIESLGNGWYRCSMIHTTLTAPRFDVYVSPTDSISAYTADGTSGVTLFGAQAEASDFGPTNYIPTTAAAVSVGPVANLPRLNYPINSDGSVGCPSLLLEPQRTNYQVYSENSAQWSTPADGLTVVYNTSDTIDPSGYYGAEKVTSASGNKRMFNGLTNPSGALTMSSFVKKGTGDEFLLRTTSGSINVQYNLTTLTITATAGTGTITDYGNGWYRVTASTTSAIANEVARYQFPNADGEYMYFWGAMAENGAYATSYIPTLGASVTRGADTCSKTGISSLIGQTEGTLFAEFSLTNYNSAKALCIVDAGSTANFIAITMNSGNPRLTVSQAGSSSVLITPAQLPFGNYKLALGYKSGDYVMYINGVQVGTSSSTVYPVGALTGYILSNSSYGQLADSVSQALLFPTRLTNQELQDLTTL